MRHFIYKMGIHFYSTTDIPLRDMAAARAHLFVAVTHTAAGFYGVPVEIKYDDDLYRIDPGPFCRLVEVAFFDPYDSLYSWALTAAAIYEVLKGETYQWQWPTSEAPAKYWQTDIFEPERQHGYIPAKSSEKLIEVSPHRGGKNWS